MMQTLSIVYPLEESIRSIVGLLSCGFALDSDLLLPDLKTAEYKGIPNIGQVSVQIDCKNYSVRLNSMLFFLARVLTAR